MSYSKKPKRPQHPARRKSVDVNPRDYTIIGHSAEFMGLHSHSKSMAQPISHSLEKWILMILLAFALAAFAGFKLLENSDLSFSITDGSSDSTYSKALAPKNDAEFRKQFKKNRGDALALMQQHKSGYKKNPKYGRGANRLYAQKTTHKVKKLSPYQKSHKKKMLAKHRKAKKTIAKR